MAGPKLTYDFVLVKPAHAHDDHLAVEVATLEQGRLLDTLQLAYP